MHELQLQYSWLAALQDDRGIILTSSLFGTANILYLYKGSCLSSKRLGDQMEGGGGGEADL
jgi:hypothetical protein